MGGGVARRPGRFGVAVPTDGRQPIWFIRSLTSISSAMVSTRPTASALYTTENDYQNAQGMIGVRDATMAIARSASSRRGMEPHDVALLADGRTMVIANGGIKTHRTRAPMS
jgi:hypothetical protein